MLNKSLLRESSDGDKDEHELQHLDFVAAASSAAPLSSEADIVIDSIAIVVVGEFFSFAGQMFSNGAPDKSVAYV